MNDFSRASDLLFSILFADDTSVFIEGTNYSDMCTILNEELDKVDIWLRANRLTINLKKTHYMLFHRTIIKNNLHQDITISGSSLTCKKSTKFLGVIIDNKLNWSEHIQYVKNKISKSNGILKKN